MSTIGDRFGASGRPNLGVGYSIPPQAEQESALQSNSYPPFRAGLDVSSSDDASDQNADPSRTVYAVDMELDRGASLIRAPGIAVSFDDAPHDLTYLFEQSSLDYTTELVAVAPPYFGYKGAADFTWVNAGISATSLYGWNALPYLGFLLFSNGVDATYYRDSHAAVITDMSADVVARTMAVAFGRKFAGNYVDGGVTQSLGVMWDDTTATVTGWAGTGSGRELLLPETGKADYVAALRTLDYDVMAILCRHSLWAGYRTGVDNRPADFRFRFGGVGCVQERTAVTALGSVTFLSDEGVVDYNINDAKVISTPINNELLPLDYTRLSQYVGAYQAIQRRYYLATPFCLYIYEYPIPEINRPGRWFKRSLATANVVAFTNPASNVYWDALIGTWDQLTSPWDQIGQPQWAAPATIVYSKGTEFGVEDPTLFTYLGTRMTPKWRTTQAAPIASDEYITQGFEIEYISTADATIAVRVPDSNLSFDTQVLRRVLPNSYGVPTKRLFFGVQSGLGVQCQIEIEAGSPKITRIRQIFERAGEATTLTMQ